jgi:hypothetical protein
VIGAGVAIGALVTAWALVMGVTGWVFDPVLSGLFGLVVVFEIAVLVVLLRATAAENGFARQVGAGTAASLVAAPIVLAQSLVFTTVLFPTYLAAHPEAGSALEQALSGVVGTVGTGVVASAVIGAFARKRG